jgi:type I restriction enzyme M protein
LSTHDWSHLQANAKQPIIGKLIDDAMVAIEAANASLKGVLPKDFNRPALDKIMLGELIDLMLDNPAIGGSEDRTTKRPPGAIHDFQGNRIRDFRRRRVRAS